VEEEAARHSQIHYQNPRGGEGKEDVLTPSLHSFDLGSAE
jgi:hypothetical protein